MKKKIKQIAYPKNTKQTWVSTKENEKSISNLFKAMDKDFQKKIK